MNDTLKLSELHPAPDNPRRDVGDVRELAASIAAVGLIQPIICTPNADGYMIVAGERRYAAAKLAGLREVPVIVREMTDEQRQEAMLVENLQREDLTPIEEASAYKALVDLGRSQRDIAKRIGRTQPHVSKRLQLLELPAPALEALDAGGIGIADALELRKLKDAPDAVVKDAIEFMQPDEWNDRMDPAAAVQQALDAAAAEAEYDTAVAQAEADPAPFIEARSSQYRKHDGLPAGAKALGKSWGALQITPAKHRKQPCHAVTVVVDYNAPRLTYICTTPANHPEAQRDGEGGGRLGALTDKEKAARKAKREHNAALREAATERHAFVQRLISKRLSASMRDDAITLLLTEWISRETGVPYHTRGAFACHLLGLEVKARGFMDGDKPAAIEEHLKKLSPDQALRVGIAVGIGAVEDTLGGNYPRWEWVQPYFDFLERHGYERHSAEILELSGKAPK